MGNDNSRKLCFEYNERINSANAKRKLGESYKIELSSIITSFKIKGGYHDFNIVKFMLKDYPNEKFYIFIEKADWKLQEKDFTKICKEKNVIKFHIYSRDSNTPKHYFVLAIIKTKEKN